MARRIVGLVRMVGPSLLSPFGGSQRMLFLRLPRYSTRPRFGPLPMQSIVLVAMQQSAGSGRL